MTVLVSGLFGSRQDEACLSRLFAGQRLPRTRRVLADINPFDTTNYAGGAHDGDGGG